MILILVGNKALNYCRFPGLQRIGIFVWAVSVTRRREERLAREGGLARCTTLLNIWFLLTQEQLWDNSPSKQRALSGSDGQTQLPREGQARRGSCKDPLQVSFHLSVIVLLIHCWKHGKFIIAPKSLRYFLIPYCYPLAYPCYLDKYPFVFPFEHSYLLTLATLQLWVPLPNLPFCGKELKHLGEGRRVYPSLFPLYITWDTRTRFINTEALKHDETVAWHRKTAETNGNCSMCPQLLHVGHCLGHRIWARTWLAVVMLSSALISPVLRHSSPFCYWGSIFHHTTQLRKPDRWVTQCQQRMVQKLKFMPRQWVARPSCQIANRYSIALCFA